MIGKEVMVALIAALASLVVSIIALTAARITARYNGALQRELEAQKEAAASEALATTIADKELQASLDALQKSVAAIQAVKDEIQLVLGSVVGSLPAETLAKRVVERRDVLSGTYEECRALLHRDDDRAMHMAKNLGFVLSQLIETSPPTYAAGGLLSTEYAAQLSRIRENLSEAQQVLRDSRSQRLQQRLMTRERSEMGSHPRK